MESRYDYRDPGTDPAYCDGLAPDDSEACDVGDVGTDAEYTRADDDACGEYHGPTCIYCSGPIHELDNNEPYCSALCACYADRDNQEDRQ